MHNIIIHLIFKDNSVIELDSFKDAMEYLTSYIAFSQDCGCSPSCLDDADNLKSVVAEGLSTSEIANIHRQMDVLASLSESSRSIN